MADLDRVSRYVELGGIPRITTFSSLTGQDYQQMPPYFDYIFPKHYYWHRGFDGMYGTIARWVQKFAEWNPSLTEADCFLLVESLFGLRLAQCPSRCWTWRWVSPTSSSPKSCTAKRGGR